MTSKKEIFAFQQALSGCLIKTFPPFGGGTIIFF